MNQITVSVIIVVQNGEKYLATAIDSVLSQTYLPNQIIIVDGNSTDKTADIAQSYNGVFYLKQTGKGLANARNTGIEKATGNLITFLDHDDHWCENKLTIQVNQFINYPEIQYSYGQVQLFLESGCELRQGFTETLLQEAQKGRTPSTLMVRKSLFEQIGKFNEEFTIGCDVEWFTRAKDDQIPYSFIPEILLYKRVHDHNLSGNVETNRKELFKIVRQSLQRQRLKD